MLCVKSDVALRNDSKLEIMTKLALIGICLPVLWCYIARRLKYFSIFYSYLLYRVSLSMLDNSKKHILIVEDDLEICRLLDMFLSSKGYRVSLSHNGTDGLKSIFNLNPDLVVLDIMMPDINGIDVCKASRESYTGPVIMLTACSEEISEISALNTGADGYLHKPLRPHILLSHIEALLRRERRTVKNHHGLNHHGLNHTGRLTINTLKRVVKQDNQEIMLTGAEYEMLVYLAKKAGTIVSRDECYRALKGVEFDGVDRALDMRLSSLRRKINDNTAPYQIIKTIRCKGYLFVKQ